MEKFLKWLWIDDINEPPRYFTHTVKTFEDALPLIENEDWHVISFDHDLGDSVERHNGLTLMNRLEELIFTHERLAPNVRVHSANAGALSAMNACANKINKFHETFPRINGGFCDGLGCGSTADFCFCTQYLKSCEEFQRKFNRQWDHNDPLCRIWEESWRFAFDTFIHPITHHKNSLNITATLTEMLKE